MARTSATATKPFGDKKGMDKKPPAFHPRAPPSIVSPSEALDALEADTRSCRDAYLEFKKLQDDPHAQIYVCGPHDQKIRLVRVQAPKLKELLCTLCGIGWPGNSYFRLDSRPGRVFIRCDQCAKHRRGPFACYDLLHFEFCAFLPSDHAKKDKDDDNDAAQPPTPSHARAGPAAVEAAPAEAAPAEAASADAAPADAATSVALRGAPSGSPAATVPRVPITPENVTLLFKAILSAQADRLTERQSTASVSPAKSTPSKGTSQPASRSVASAVPSSSKTSAGSAPSSDDEDEEATESRGRAQSNASARTAADESAPRARAPLPVQRAGLNSSREITVLLEHLDHAMDSYKIAITNNTLTFSTLAIYVPVLAKPNKRPIALELFNRSQREWIRFGRYSSMNIYPGYNKVIGRFVHSPGLSLEDEVIVIDDDSPPKSRKRRNAGAQAGPSTLKKRRGADDDEDPFGFFS